MERQTFDILPGIFDISSHSEFNSAALSTFRTQATDNNVYSRYLSLLKIKPEAITSVGQIPFLPIEFFKTHKVVTGSETEELIFESSGTTGQQASRHYVLDKSLYEKSFVKTFNIFFCQPETY